MTNYRIAVRPGDAVGRAVVAESGKTLRAVERLFTIARNLAIDSVRRTRRPPVDPIDDTAELALLETAPDAAEVLDHAERHAAMLAALETLPERCREVMLLRYVDGFSAPEIAVHLGLAAATVRVVIFAPGVPKSPSILAILV